MAKKSKGKLETPTPEPPEKKGKKKGKSEEPTPDDGPKKPQRGLAIGDNFGWTGKLPATLLFEYAQKQKWEKVIIDMRKNGKGFTGVVNFAWKNPKTQELIKVQMVPNLDLYTPKETTNEARHYAATYAMHRINFHKNLKMVLPKIFRDYWADLETNRLELSKRDKTFHDQLFNANPFQVFLEQREKKQSIEREREVKKLNEEKTRKPTINISTAKKMTDSGKLAPQNEIKKRNLTKNAYKILKRVPQFPSKVWKNAPFIDFDTEIRTKIEASIRNHINWTIESAHNKLDTQIDYEQLLETIGFRSTHIKEAFLYTSTFTDALEWLIFHIPEDDLPVAFLKREEDSGVSVKVSRNVKLENLVQRLSQSGADKDEILEVCKSKENDEVLSAIDITYKMVGYKTKTIEFDDEESSKELWIQEIEGLEMTNPEIAINFNENNEDIVTISLSPKRLAKDLVSLKLFRSRNYPENLLGFQIVVNAASFRIANYIKISIVKKLAKFILSNQLLGTCHIYSMVEWLEDNISNIIDEPGPLFVEEEYTGHGRIVSNTIGLGKYNRTSYKASKGSVKKDVTALENAYQSKQNSSHWKKSISQRKNLPAWSKSSKLVDAITNNRVVIITGETGSGKSTQVVQFVLDNLNKNGNFRSKIICTQPRRISTIGLAERISDERVDEVGQETGYIIRGENKTNLNTRLTFVTTGVLLRMIQGELSLKRLEEGIFADLEYIFVDEVHERSVDSDFLLIILRNLLQKLPKLTVVLMSATVNIDIFTSFFNISLKHIHIEGRTFPIEDHYLEEIIPNVKFTIENRDGEVVEPKPESAFFQNGSLNYLLFAKVCNFIDNKLKSEGNNGSILIFLPGIMEINKCIKEIERESNKFWCLPLHSALSSADQKRVFHSPPSGLRKVVVSTNVAETSITIPDCVAVVDSGRVKSTFFDSLINSTKLVENWCSRAEVSQRRGRSGRITEGTCYHLYTKDTEKGMMPQPIPEIKRTRLENLILVVKSMGIDKVEDFLKSGLDPPDLVLVSKSKQFLLDIGALEENESISTLGKYLSLLPTDLQSGKLLIFGCIFKCLGTCLTIAAASITGNPFKGSFENRDEVRNIQGKFADHQGDTIAVVNAFNEYSGLQGSAKKKFLVDNYLSFVTMKEIEKTRNQFIGVLQEIGFVPLNYKSTDISLNLNNGNFNVVKAIITGAFYPQVARIQLPTQKYQQTSVGAVSIDPEANKAKFWIRSETYMENLKDGKEDSDVLPAERAFIHPSSVMFSAQGADLGAVKLSSEGENGEQINQDEYKIDFSIPDLSKFLLSRSMLKAPFVVYNSTNVTSKLFLREITPTTVISVLLFGGQILYDISNAISSGKASPGIVVDGVWPIRTWCKNGVLIKRLRHLVDGVVEERLSNPYYLSQEKSSADDVLSVVEQVLAL